MKQEKFDWANDQNVNILLINKSFNSFFLIKFLQKFECKTDPVSNEVEHFCLLVFPWADVSGWEVGGGREEAVGRAQLCPAGAPAAHQQRAQPQHLSSLVVGSEWRWRVTTRIDILTFDPPRGQLRAPPQSRRLIAYQRISLANNRWSHHSTSDAADSLHEN